MKKVEQTTEALEDSIRHRCLQVMARRDVFEVAEDLGRIFEPTLRK